MLTLEDRDEEMGWRFSSYFQKGKYMKYWFDHPGTAGICCNELSGFYHAFKSSVKAAFLHDDDIKWKHFPRNWPFVREITGPGDFPTQRSVTQSFDVFFDLR